MSVESTPDVTPIQATINPTSPIDTISVPTPYRQLLCRSIHDSNWRSCSIINYKQGFFRKNLA
jgi:hypothetical protein